ncbi:hypothetical protein BDN72DRAFT_842851 [Pluteus cervinus]|uniref:Uncharacterized protein n=1 Tax=Pluteus cervinus TaxID=181527 RepID=A0ACD3APZ5_9AGAR|nr:hypothetical protein BDN72DRAFT_842851 [Pluteus cervinus]
MRLNENHLVASRLHDVQSTILVGVVLIFTSYSGVVTLGISCKHQPYPVLIGTSLARTSSSAWLTTAGLSVGRSTL